MEYKKGQFFFKSNKILCIILDIEDEDFFDDEFGKVYTYRPILSNQRSYASHTWIMENFVGQASDEEVVQYIRDKLLE